MTFYTDGACSANGKAGAHGGFGVVWYEEDKIMGKYQEFVEGTTNNRMELSAILWVLENYGKSVDTPIVYSDSGYCVNTLTNWMFSWEHNGWIKSDKRTPENLDIIKKYFNLLKDGYRIDLRQIKGHSRIEGNEIADQLATGKMIINQEVH